MTKITKFELYFVILILPVLFFLWNYDTTLRNNELSRIQYDNAIDRAVEDGILHMVEYDSTDDIIINRDSVVENYFESAYAGLGITDSPSAKDWLQIYTPVILLTDIDGFYVYHCYDVPASDGGTHTLSGWSEKYTYAYQGGQYVLSFTITDTIKVYDATSGTLMDGDYHDLMHVVPQLTVAFPFLSDDNDFKTVRDACMADAISERMEYYINEHNRIANDYGIKYHFYLPSVSDDDWERAINGISMMVVFQGYPYPSGRGYFNLVAVGGARLAKSNAYYITSENGMPIYHRDGCPLITSTSREHPYDKARTCAGKGAYPCSFCNP